MKDFFGLTDTAETLSTEGVKVEITIKNSEYMKLFGLFVGIIIFGTLGYYLTKGTLAN